MKRSVLLSLCVLVLPAPVVAQAELGMDAGFLIIGLFEDRDDITQLSVPNGSLRIGFPRETVTFETLVSFSLIRSGSTVSALSLTPGINVSLGEGGAYARGEVGVLVGSGGGTTDTEFAVGGALGVKRAIGDGPFSFRFEAGFDRWLDDADFNQARLLAGLSALVG